MTVLWDMMFFIVLCVSFFSDYANDPHSPRTVQQSNGTIPNQKPRTYDNQGMLSIGTTQHVSDTSSWQGTLTRPNNFSTFTNMSSMTGNTNLCKSYNQWVLLSPWPHSFFDLDLGYCDLCPNIQLKLSSVS